jgi:hypothetical protein
MNYNIKSYVTMIACQMNFFWWYWTHSINFSSKIVNMDSGILDEVCILSSQILHQQNFQ